MARIKIADMPRDAKISKDEMRSVTGGISVTNNHYVDPYAINVTNNHREALFGAMPIPLP